MATTWGENIRRLREARHMSKAAFAAKVGVSGATVSDWESGEIKSIDGGNLLKVASVLGTTAEAIFDDGPPHVAEPAAAYASEESVVLKVPVLTDVTPSADGSWTISNFQGDPAVAHVVFPTQDRTAFGLLVPGDSLRPRFKPGEIVVVEPKGSIRSGDEVAMQLKDGRLLLRVFDWKRSGQVQTSSVTEDQRPMTLREDSIMFLYRVLGAVPADRLVTP